MLTFKALTIAQVVAAAALILAASVYNGMILPVCLGVLIYGLPTLYVDLQQARHRKAYPQGIVEGFYKAGVGKFCLTLCGFALIFSTGPIQHVEGVFVAYLVMWLVHTMTLFETVRRYG